MALEPVFWDLCKKNCQYKNRNLQCFEDGHGGYQILIANQCAQLINSF